MAPLVGGSKVISGDRSVNLSGGQINVTQELLNGTEVSPAFEKVCRKGVSECVWEAGHASVENTSNPTRIQGTPAHTHEQSALSRRLCKSRPSIGEPSVERPTRRAADWHNSLAIALASDRDEVPLDIGSRESGQFGHPHSRRVQQLQQGPVPQRCGIVTIDRLDRLGHSPGGQCARKRSWRTSRVHSHRRVGGHVIASDTEGEEASDNRDLSGNRRARISPGIEVGDPAANNTPIDRLEVIETQSITEVEKRRDVTPIGVVGVRRQAAHSQVLVQEEIQLFLGPTGDHGDRYHTSMLRPRSRPPVTIATS